MAHTEPPRPEPTANELRFYKWRRLIPNQPFEPYGYKLDQFFQTGRSLVQGDLDGLQDTIKMLASEHGCHSIRELVEQRIQQCQSPQARLDLWISCVRPLFDMLTEPRVTRSTILETYVGTIFNAFLGYGAARLGHLYGFLDHLARHWPPPGLTSDGPKSTFLELCTTILAKVIECNSLALLGDVAPPIVGRFEALVDSLGSNDRNFSYLQASKNIEYIQRRLASVKRVDGQSSVAPEPVAIATDSPRQRQ
ncbi:Uu.00g138890.m01.CDS01 [Anthostomella pinea]|uniref:Uu.00g138890.m01.CDS01 n=1 Tax=Anthostomella pinea TaxID=933095 RepID=A0AAI8VQQ3_9PEZI|nr:Uu.00g138890.m01.CDS01 [Anthostomella pinea]